MTNPVGKVVGWRSSETKVGPAATALAPVIIVVLVEAVLVEASVLGLVAVAIVSVAAVVEAIAIAVVEGEDIEEREGPTRTTCLVKAVVL